MDWASMPRLSRLQGIAHRALPGPRADRLHDPHRLDAHRRDAREQVDHALLVVSEAVGVELRADRRVLGFLFLVLVEHPFDGVAIAEQVAPGARRNAGERRLAVDGDAAGLLV